MIADIFTKNSHYRADDVGKARPPARKRPAAPPASATPTPTPAAPTRPAPATPARSPTSSRGSFDMTEETERGAYQPLSAGYLVVGGPCECGPTAHSQPDCPGCGATPEEPHAPSCADSEADDDDGFCLACGADINKPCAAECPDALAFETAFGDLAEFCAGCGSARDEACRAGCPIAGGEG